MLADDPPVTPEMASEPPMDPIRLLIVEDNRDSRRSLERLFQFYGFVVTAAADAQSALEILRHEPPPQAVLTDLLLPDTDGRVVLQSAAALKPRPYLALITGWNPAEDDPMLQAIGLDGLFLKPLNVRDIATIVQQHVRAQDRSG